MGKTLVISGVDFSENKIPDQHVYLDWIASSQDLQYFNLGITAKQKMRIEIELSATQEIVNSTSTDKIGIVGCGTNTSSALGIYYIPNYTCYTSNSSALDTYVSGCKFTDTSRHILSIDQVKFTIDSVEKKTFTEGVIDDTQVEYKLYAMGTNRSYQMSSLFHIHSVKIYSDRDNSNSLIHHYVPVKKADNTICLYDIIEDSYIYVTGSGVPDYGL